MPLAAEASVNMADGDLMTPCYIAAGQGRADALRLLLDARADANQPKKDAFTPALIAVQNGHVECLRLLIGAGCDINQVRAGQMLLKTPLIQSALQHSVLGI